MTALEITLAAVVYASCGLICARLMAGHLAYRFRDMDAQRWPTIRSRDRAPSGEQWFGSWCIGLCIGVIWPSAWLIWRVFSWAPGIAIGAEARDRKYRDEKRISELERQAGFR